MSSVAYLFQRYRRKIALCLGILWVAFVVTFPVSGYVRGLAMGSFDVMIGRPKLLVVGLPLVGPEFGHLIQQRYGLNLRLLGCEADSMKAAYVDGNNRVVLAVVKHRYGVSLFELLGTRGSAAHGSVSRDAK